MEHRVHLGADKFVGIQDRFLAGEKTCLVFDSSDYPLDELVATVTDGRFAKRYNLKGAKLDISEYCKKASVIEIQVALILKGTIAKTWCLEPFVVRENGQGYVLIPEIALLRREIRTMKKIIKEMNTKINDTM